MKKKKNKKIFILKGIFFLICLFFIIPMLSFFVFTQGATESIPPPTSIEKAEEYKAIANESGIDWAQLLIYDFIKYEDLEKINPNETALEFYVVSYTVSEYSSKKKKWKIVEQIDYQGKEEIEKFFRENNIHENIEVNNLFSNLEKIQEKLDEKSSDSKKYKVSTKIKTFEEMVEDFEEGDKDIALSLYEGDIIPQMYEDELPIDFEGDYNLPDIIIGDFTREDVIKVAKSILNHPYLIGSKDPRKGKPTKPLDCSGYIDWVYFQLTGKTVGAGTAGQFARTKPISHNELKPGDLGFYDLPQNVHPPDKWNHVGIYMGTVDGKDLFIHCGGSGWKTKDRPKGRVLITYNNTSARYNGNASSKFKYFRRINIDYKNE